MERFRFSLTLLFLAAGAGVFVFLLPPVAQRVRAAQKDVALAEARLARERAIAEKFDALRETIAATPQRAAVETALPPTSELQEDVADTLAMIEDIAVREAAGIFLNGITISDAQPLERLASGDAPKPGSLVARAIAIDGIGSYDSVGRFLDALRFSLRLFEPVKFSFAAGDGSDIFAFQMTLRTFTHVPCVSASSCSMASLPRQSDARAETSGVPPTEE